MADTLSVRLLDERARLRESERSEADRAVRAQLAAIVAELGAEEVRVLGLLAKRLLEGMTIYGQLDVANDPRDFDAERADELADALVYGAMAELRRLVTRKAAG